MTKYAIWIHPESDEVGVIPEDKIEEYCQNPCIEIYEDSLTLEEANKLGKSVAIKRNYTFHKY